MNFRKKGWLKKYTDYRSGQPFSVQASLVDTDPETLEKSIYNFLQPTGLLYGFPVEFPFQEEAHPTSNFYATSDKAQLIFLDCLFGSLSAYSANFSGNSEKRFAGMCELLSAYFDSLPGSRQAAEAKKPWAWRQLFIKNTNPYERLEQNLKKHLNFSAGLTSFSVYFANSLLFLDIYGCMRYSASSVKTLPGKLAEVKAEQQKLRVTALKLIAAAAHANGIIEKEESQIYFQFLRSANINPELSQQLREVFDKGITLQEIEIPEVSWLAKRYFLEVAILTIMADKDVSVEEEIFLWQLCGRLNLPTAELEQAMAALQTFLITHESTLHFFKNEIRFSFASESLKTRIGRIISQNKDRILMELKKSSDTYALLQKARLGPLTSDEKRKIKQQLYAIIRNIPTLGMLQATGNMIEVSSILRMLSADNNPATSLD